jgi:GWxTD domain-containing protein
MRRRFFIFALLTSLLPAQDNPSSSSSPETGTLTKRQIAAKQKALEKELMGPWRKWMNEDVFYIITDQEKQAFKRLKTDEERQQFVEQFWLRRDPTPDTEENEYQEEHYRRIAYANDHYASGIPGWKTDRGMIYIKYGAADEIESHPSGGSYQRPIAEGGGQTSTYPFETWRYRHLDGLGSSIVIEFVDPTMSGEYHMTINPSEKDALLYVPGTPSSASRMLTPSTSGQFLPESMNEFTRLQQMADLHKPPAVKFKDLEAAVESTIHYQTLPMQVRVDYIRVTSATVLASLTIHFKNSDLQYATKEKVAKASVNLYGRITSLTRRPVNWFEDSVQMEVPAEMLPQSLRGSRLYSKVIPLAPGTYRLNIAAKDMVGNTMNNFEMPLIVPRYDDEQLAASSIILADQLERLPAKSIGTGPFVIRDSKVRPRVGGIFKQGETVAIYTEFYNFGMDDKTHKPSGSIQYEVVNMSNNQTVLSQTEDLGSIPNASAFLVTVGKKILSKSLPPGMYKLQMKVTDKLKNQTLSPSVTFTVTT